jgi:hypothetical protein
MSIGVPFRDARYLTIATSHLAAGAARAAGPPLAGPPDGYFE